MLQVELLLASPLRRALQTCALAFKPCVERGLTIIALPMAEEATGDPCDTGSEVEELEKDFPESVDFDHVKHGWWVHEGEYGVSVSEWKTMQARTGLTLHVLG